MSALAQDNPFEQAAQQNYGGRFWLAAVELRLKPDGTRYGSSLILQGNNYTVEAGGERQQSGKEVRQQRARVAVQRRVPRQTFGGHTRRSTKE